MGSLQWFVLVVVVIFFLFKRYESVKTLKVRRWEKKERREVFILYLSSCQIVALWLKFVLHPQTQDASEIGTSGPVATVCAKHIFSLQELYSGMT